MPKIQFAVVRPDFQKNIAAVASSDDFRQLLFVI
jgi:hypothetical protein